eukprot:scaffold3126_cov201-Alexandrium_tamarense.AAC.9
MYFFQALWPDGTVAVNEEDILQILLAIRADASKVAPEVSSRNALGVLTTLPRREWASARDHIISSSIHNSTALDIVDGALFILVIDDMTPKDIHEAAANMLHGTYNLRSEDNLNNLVDYQAGTCTNRWYDKLQVIVCKDGRAGINFEHSAIDGHTALRFVSDIFADNVVSFAQSITQTVYSDRHMFPPLIQAHLRRASLEHPQLVAPRKLTFELPQCVLDKIYYAETSLSDQIVASDTFVLEFTGYGKNFIVRNKMSPDSYVQLSMQLAYYRLYGKIVSQYEPVLTKAFYHGRTEAMRTATEKAALFCKKWLDPSATNEEKLEALRVATQYHSAGIKLASTGQGIERHLFALKCIADKNGIPTPDFFSSEAYTRLNHTILSTSNCGNPSLKCELSVAVFSVMDIPEAKTAPATSIPVEYLEDYDYFGAESATVAISGSRAFNYIAPGAISIAEHQALLTTQLSLVSSFSCFILAGRKGAKKHKESFLGHVLPSGRRANRFRRLSLDHFRPLDQHSTHTSAHYAT